MTEFKVALLGDRKVGKSSFISRVFNGDYKRQYVPSLDIKETILTFNSANGLITFKIKEFSEKKLHNLNLKKDFDCIILISNKKINLIEFQKNIAFKNYPIVFVQSKCDFCFENNIQDKIIRISSRNNVNLELPFLELVKKLSNNSIYKFCEKKPVFPPTANIIN